MHEIRKEVFVPSGFSIAKIIGVAVYFTCNMRIMHRVKSVHIRSYSSPFFPAFGLNTERYGVSLRIQSECRKMQTRITPNMETFHAVMKVNFTIYFNYF